MKFFGLVTFLPLLLSSSAVFAAVSRDVIRARQAHVRKDLIDICVPLDLDVEVAPDGHNIVVGHLKLCLCLSVLPGFLVSNSVAKTVVKELGPDGARDYFTKLIQSQQNKQQCHYPPHATPAPLCNIQNPCDFTCGDGYTPYPSPNPTKCVCKPPHTECNGVCGSFPRGCGSQGASRVKRDQPTCPVGKTMCGVPNGGSGVDCVNTSGDLESCGGCSVAHPFGDNVANGKNCKTIPNVNRVTCDDGVCKVQSCKNGFEVSPSRDSCVERHLNRVRKTRGVEVVDGGSDLRRDTTYTPPDVIIVLLKKGLIIRCNDFACIEGLLGAKIEAFGIDDLLKLLVVQGIVVKGTTLIYLREMFGLDLTIL